MISLHVITEYSLLKSLIKVKDLISFLCKHNIKTCGICDNELFGVMEFYHACHNNNIKPIIGLEVEINEKTLYLYPKNYKGYQKLLKINSIKDNDLTYNDIEDNNMFIIIPYSAINIYDSFNIKENVYIAYQNNDEKKNALIVSNNILYFNPVRTFAKKDIDYLKFLNLLGSEFNYQNDEYFNINIQEDDQKRIEDFASKIDIVIPEGKRYIPVYKKGANSKDYLFKLASLGLEKRFKGNIPDKYKKRLNEELKIINDMGFTDYFLIVYDYVLFAKKNNILVGPGRGSAAGSLISYAIGITDIDPIKYDLLFARFLNPNRKKMPDIDIDFEDAKRMDVINYVKEKYGEKRVALGLTFNTFKSKLVLRDLARILKVNENLFNKFIKEIDSNKTLKDNLNDKVKKYLDIYPELNNLYDIAIHFEGLKKNISTHAAGVVICSEDLDNIIPTYNDNEFLKTGITMEYLEGLGLLKMDFLGLRNLSIIADIKKSIPSLDLKDISLEDSKTFELFQKGDTDDIFQFESQYAKNSLVKLKIENFDELAIAIALVRPGPNNQIDNYIKNKKSGIKDVHKDLVPILQSTKGIIIFQEQVMQILQVIAGYTSYEADNIRIAISKKKEDIIIKEEENFIKRAIKNGYDESFATNLFNQIKRFADYGFNKAHAVSYALISYQMAYLKANYPLEFTLTLLKDIKDDNNKKRLLNDIKMKKIRILKPNINYSTNEYLLKNNSLLLPFNIIKGLSINIINDLLNVRGKKFNDVFDFMLKTKDFMNDKTYEMLVKSGVLDDFKYNKKSLMENYDILHNYADLGDESFEKPILQMYDEYDLSTLREMEKTYYGFYIGNHPCSVYSKVVKVNKTKDYLFKNIKMALMVEKITNIKTKDNKEMAFVLASDETGSIELTIFPDVFKTCPKLSNSDIIFIEGKSSKRYDKYQIIVNKIERK